MAKKKAKAAKPPATKKKLPAKKAARKSPAKKKVAKKATKKAAKKAPPKKVVRVSAKKPASAKKKAASKVKIVPGHESKKPPRALKQCGVSHDARELLKTGKYNVIEACEILSKTYRNSTPEQLKRVCWTQADLARKDFGEKAPKWKPSPRGRRAS